MTISYTREVATCTGFGCFLKLLVRWRASVYKLIWRDLLVFLAAFYTLNCLYRFAMDASAKYIFESLVLYFRKSLDLIPLVFVLGFYVSIIMSRWWNQYMTIPWPDPLAVYVSTMVHGQDEHGRMMRRTVMRYVCLSFTMVMAMISPPIKRQFPTLNQFIEAGLLNENEKLIIEGMDVRFPKHPKFWMSIVWASSIITRARKEGRIRDDYSMKTIIDELNKFRERCMDLIHYDMISIPLVYTQVVTIAVYTYFLGTLMGKQWIDKEDKAGYFNTVDNIFPVFMTLEFFFYMGWLRVAESLFCPFGEDDDDFDLNWMIHRYLQVSYLIVDEMHHEHPQLVRDQYWDDVFPNQLPYAADDIKREEPPEPSTANLDFPTTTPSAKTSQTQLVEHLYERRGTLVHFDIPEEEEPDRYQTSSVASFIEDEHVSVHRQSMIDEFETLRMERERERIDRQMQKLARQLANANEVIADVTQPPSAADVPSGAVSREESPRPSQQSDTDTKKDDQSKESGDDK